MRLPNYLKTSLAAGALVALLAACSGAGESPTPTGPGSPGASPTVTDFAPSPTATPATTESPEGTLPIGSPSNGTATPTNGTATPTNGTAAGTECANMPTFAPGAPEPSFAADEELEALFPQSIDGNPVTNVESLQWVQFICLFGGQAAVDEMREDAEGDLNLVDLSFASAEVTLDGETIEMSALRYPGQRGELLDNLARLMRAMGEDIDDTDDFQTGTIGGKDVIWWSENGESVYVYESSDVVFTVEGVTEAQAEQIFSALP